MKKLLLAAFIIFTFPNLYAQVADGITYQAVALDDKGTEIAGMDINGNILHSKEIGVRFTIIEDNTDGTILYQETHQTYTDNNGLFSLVIGHGEKTTSGSFSKLTDINWGASKLFLKVELDVKNRGDYKIMGIQQMMAVPFAFHSFSSSTVLDENIDTSFTNEIQFISISNDTIYLSNGGFAILPENSFNGDYNDLVNKPDLGLFLTSEEDGSVTNELQFISISNDTIYLSNGGFVKLPANNFSGNFNDLFNIPVGLADGDDNTQLTEAEVDAYVDNNGYLKTESDPQFGLSEANKITDAGSGLVITTAERTKLNNLIEGAEINVQINWNEIDNTSDAFILNKPTLAAVATSGSYNDLSDKPTTLAGYGIIDAFDGDYNNLTNKPVFFTGSYTDLTNQPTLFDGAYSSLTGKPVLATIATSGSYTDLSDKPTTIAGYGIVDAFDGNYNNLTNKPVLFSGSYTDLTNKPILFDGAYSSLTGKPILSTVATSGSYNDLSDRPTTLAGYGIIDAFDGDYNNLTNTPVLFSGSFTDLTNIPVGISDGDDNTQLTEAQVDAYTDNNGYLKTESDPQFGLSEANKIADAGSGLVMTSVERTKLNNLVEGAEINVQSNWTEADNTSDAFIMNKPILATVDKIGLPVKLL